MSGIPFSGLVVLPFRKCVSLLGPEPSNISGEEFVDFWVTKVGGRPRPGDDPQCIESYRSRPRTHTTSPRYFGVASPCG